ncbi:MAG: V-type ATP synthase subunit E family protein [Candidatus Bathyarchaeia archaeon]
MSVEKIREYIERETEAEAKKILSEAESEAKKIVEEAKRKASARLEELKQRRIAETVARERSEISIMKMAQRAELTKIKTEWLNRAFEEAYKRIQDMAKDPDSRAYRDFLVGLVVEGAINLRGSKLLLKTDVNSSKVLHRSLKEILERVSKVKGEKIELEIEDTPDSQLGVIIQSSDGRQYYVNTLEARLEKVRDRLAGTIYNMLFKEGD